MAGVTQVSLTVSGIVNNQAVFVSGSLDVDATAGIKSGVVNVNQADDFVTISPDGYAMPMPRCFVGARPIDSGMVNPLRLLGTHFVSQRITDFGSGRQLSQGEHATLRGHTLHSTQIVFGRVPRPRVAKVARIREVLEFTSPSHLSAVGRYSLETASGGTIPVRYRQLYEAFRPNLRLFRAVRKKKFLLKAEVCPTYRGRVVKIRTKSTLEYI